LESDLKPHQNDTAIGYDLTGWGHHTIIKPSEDQSENDDSDHERTDWGHRYIVKRSADVGSLPLQQRNMSGCTANSITHILVFDIFNCLD